MHSHRAGIPNPSLIAILLVVRSTSGVNFVFHYPAKPSYGAPAVSRRGSRGTTTDYGGTDSSTSATPSSSDAEPEPDTADVEHAAAQSVAYDVSESAFSRHHRRHRVPRSDADSDDSDDAFARRGDGGIPWDTVLGFKTEFLAGLLAPRAALCRTRFELSVDDLVFLGFPLHVRPDGSWRKRRPRRPRKRRDGSRSSDDEGGDGTGAGEADDEEEGDEGEEADDEAGGNDDDDGSGDANSPSDGSAMSMFHLVFVLNPPELEYAVRTQEMFDFVVRRFTRALKHEQAKDGYVWREAEKITRVKEQGAQKELSFRDCWREVLRESNLAFSISRVFSEISRSRIAHILLNNSLALSFQIPIICDISVLPSLTDPQMPGLPLTTANSFGNDDAEGDTLLAKHFTLLFLSEPASILRELANEATPISASLSHFVRACRPTASFLQISATSGIPLHEIQILARHLIHWRKARAIPPIHQRDTYIVSPNADMKRLSQYANWYAKAFPTLPALSKVLALMSAKPKPFATFIPSRDHRSAYLEILAWLLRHGLVTQLRNFAWVRIPRRIKLQVLRERRGQAVVPPTPTTATATVVGVGEVLESPEMEAESPQSLHHPYSLQDHLVGESTSPPDSPTYTTHMGDSIILNDPSSAAPVASPSSSSSSSLNLDNPNSNPNNNNNNNDSGGGGGGGGGGEGGEEMLEDSFILEPHQASGLESAWLEAAVREQPPDVQALWDRIVKYLNGQHAIEKIAVREGIGRKDVRRVLMCMEEFVVYGRHW